MNNGIIEFFPFNQSTILNLQKNDETQTYISI